MARRDAQIWSTDLLIGVIIFLLAIGVFYFFANDNAKSNESKLLVQSQIVAGKVVGDGGENAIDGAMIKDDDLTRYATMDYAQLKTELGVQDDFCILLEDQNGGLLLIGDPTDHDSLRVGIGKPDLLVTVTKGAGALQVRYDDIPCGASCQELSDAGIDLCD